MIKTACCSSPLERGENAQRAVEGRRPPSPQPGRRKQLFLSVFESIFDERMHPALLFRHRPSCRTRRRIIGPDFIQYFQFQTHQDLGCINTTM